jgi:hypothetical protein
LFEITVRAWVTGHKTQKDATDVGLAATRGFIAAALCMGVVALGATGTAMREHCADAPAHHSSRYAERTAQTVSHK